MTYYLVGIIRGRDYIDEHPRVMWSLLVVSAKKIISQQEFPHEWKDVALNEGEMWRRENSTGDYLCIMPHH